jgi:hypothetical protein
MLVGSLGEELGGRILKKKRAFLYEMMKKRQEIVFYSAYVSLANQPLWPFRKRVIFRSDQHKTHSRKLVHSHIRHQQAAPHTHIQAQA